MPSPSRSTFFLLAIAAVAALGWSLRQLRSAEEPAAGRTVTEERTIDFRQDVVPILLSRCAGCHTGDDARAEFRIDSRELFLKGGYSGEVALPGKSRESYLVDLISASPPDLVMPLKGNHLTDQEIATLRAWIDQGVAWEDGYNFLEEHRRRILPRRPEIAVETTAAGSTNPIDRILEPYFAENGVEDRELAVDRTFARRVYLDLIGLLPSPEQLDTFVADTRPDKRARLVRSLLDDREAYATHWLTFWNDALRNAYRGTGYIDGGRKQITGWLYRALHENKPYDRFVHELIDPTPESEGFIRGIKWRGVVNASQRTEMQAAQNIAQVFLGTNLKCASCHDSFVNDWTLRDSYGMAGVFAEKPLELHRCNKPMGEFVEPKFIFDGLGRIDPKAPRSERMRQLADIVTGEDDGRLTRTMVNRLWAQLLGRGLVEPVDDLDREPFSRDLLDFLAADLADHGYDLKHTLELICTSDAYQLRSVGAPRPDETGFVFRGPLVKRMTAEQFVDALGRITGIEREATPGMLRGGGGGPGGQLAAIRQVLTESRDTAAPDNAPAQWIWSHADAHRSDPGGRILLRRTLRLESLPEKAVAAMTCDNELVFYLNGRKLAASSDWQQPVAVDLTPHLTIGANVLAVEAINWPDEETGKGLEFRGKPNPAGFVFFAAAHDKDDSRLWSIASDASWIWNKGHQQGWQKVDFDTEGWKHAAELKPAGDMGPKLLAALEQPSGGVDVRAALADADPLLRALGRPNREQVVTRRDAIATTLEALELTNGPTLDAVLRQGAREWLERSGGDSQQLVGELYRIAFGRLPTAEESAVAQELAGQPPTQEGAEDLLWALVMLPEFQLIY